MRMFALFVLVQFAVVLMTSCGTHLIVGGKCVPGRVLVVVTPRFVPAAAVWRGRAGRPAPWGVLLLSVFAVWVFVLSLLHAERLSKQFVFPIQTLAQVVPTFDYLCMPWLDPYEADLHPFGIVFLAVSAFLFLPLARDRRVAIPALVLLVIAGILAHATNPQRKRSALGPASMTKTLMVADLSHAHCHTSGGAAPQAPVDIRSALNLFDGLSTQAIASVTTEDLGVRQRGNLVCQPRLETNDWAGRGYAWTTVVAPFRSGKGRRLLALTGRLSGTATPVLAVREGAHDVGEMPLEIAHGGHFETCVDFRTENRGDLYILVRLEGGEGTMRLEKIALCPVAPAVADAMELTVPPADEL